MYKLRQKISITDAEDTKIRRQWDQERGRWYFSVTDIMAVLTDSVDARNYWKALKSRLKTTHNQLVMDCNQLKMKSGDGKFYKVDTADADTLLKIIKIVAPLDVIVFKSWFDHIEVQNSINTDMKKSEVGNINWSQEPVEQEISTVLEPSVDIYENKSEIIVELMLAAMNPDKIIITANMNILTVQGKRVEVENISPEDYFYKELKWGEFYKQIELPSLVDVDNIGAVEQRGLITITLPKIDQNKTRFIKIKSI